MMSDDTKDNTIFLDEMSNEELFAKIKEAEALDELTHERYSLEEVVQSMCNIIDDTGETMFSDDELEKILMEAELEEETTTVRYTAEEVLAAVSEALKK